MSPWSTSSSAAEITTGAANDRDALLDRGQVRVVAPGPADELVALAREQLRDAFAGHDPRTIRHRWTNDRFFRSFAAPRQGFGQRAEVRHAVHALLQALGWQPGQVRVDAARIRAVPSRGDKIPEARPAFGLHRDTWYANPGHQINHWIPVYDVDATESLVILPPWFDRPIPNSSASFDLDNWQRMGGFQAFRAPTRSPQHHPVPTVAVDVAAAWRYAGPAGAVVAFAGCQLHGTVPHTTGRVRYSVEIRCVDVRDAGRGDPSGDNAAIGDASHGYAGLDDAHSAAGSSVG